MAQYIIIGAVVLIVLIVLIKNICIVTLSFVMTGWGG